MSAWCHTKCQRVLQWSRLKLLPERKLSWSWYSSSLVVLQFNDGAKALQDVLEEMGCSVGEYRHAQKIEDKMRLRKCEKKETLEQEKKQRKVRKRRRKGREEQAVDEEGTTYETRAF